MDRLTARREHQPGHHIDLARQHGEIAPIRRIVLMPKRANIPAAVDEKLD